MAKVIDVSSWQHKPGVVIDWAEVKTAGYEGVMVKASQGKDYVNPYLKDDLDSARAAGLLVGAYHFADPSRSTADEGALNFLQAVAGQTLDLAIALDWEQLGSFPVFQSKDWITAWAVAVEGKAPVSLLYVDESNFTALGDVPTGMQLWAADFTPTHAVAWMTQDAQETVPTFDGVVDVSTLASVRGINVGPSAPIVPVVKGELVMPVINLNDTGLPVQLVQRMLNRTGAALVTDSIYGPISQEAVKVYQGAHGLAQDGVVGPLTWGSLVVTVG